MAVGQPQRVPKLCERQRANNLVNETVRPNPIFSTDREENMAVGLMQRNPNLCERQRANKLVMKPAHVQPVYILYLYCLLNLKLYNIYCLNKLSGVYYGLSNICISICRIAYYQFN